MIERKDSGWISWSDATRVYRQTCCERVRLLCLFVMVIEFSVDVNPAFLCNLPSSLIYLAHIDGLEGKTLCI